LSLVRVHLMIMSQMLGDGPSLTTILIGFLGLGIVGLCLSLLRWWAPIPIICVLCLWAIALLGDFYADDLYPVNAAHPEFLYSATIAIVVGILLPVVGIVIHIARRIKKVT